MTTDTTEPIRFDNDSHAMGVARAERALATALADAESAAAGFAEAEDNLATTLANPASAEAIRDARDQHEFAGIVKDRADRAVIVARAELEGLGTADATLAAELADFGRAIVGNHPRVTVVVGAGHLAAEPDLSAGDPVVSIRQTGDTVRSTGGWLSGAVEISYWRDPELHRDLLSRESLERAAARTGVHVPTRVLDRMSVSERHNRVVVELDLVSVMPALPIVLAEPDLDALADQVADWIASSAERERRTVRAEARGECIVSEDRTGDVVERVADVLLGVSTGFGYGEPDLGGLLSSVTGWVGHLADEPTSTLGRIVSAEVADRGTPVVLRDGVARIGGMVVRIRTVAKIPTA